MDRNGIVTLAVCSAAHAVVDAVCATILFGGISAGRIHPAEVMPAFVLYALVAFGIQPVIGIVADWFALGPRVCAAGGALLCVLAVPAALVSGIALLPVLVAGLGNAAFHVGAGAASLRLTPGRALAPGVFVAPGAAGLAFGSVLGRAGVSAWPIALLLASLVPLIATTVPASEHAAAPVRSAAPGPPRSSVEAGILLVLLVVASRSFVGTAVSFPWKSQPGMLVALTGAVVLGKALGGALADRHGRGLVGGGTLALSVPLLLLGATHPSAGVAGMLAFNMTMPITLVAVSEGLPGMPGFAFGLTCVALYVGALPMLVGMQVPAVGQTAVALIVGCSAVLLLLGLRTLDASTEAAGLVEGRVSEGSA